MRRAKIVELDQTCGAYPSQWEGKLDDGRHVYIRYRGGHGVVGIGKTADEAVDHTIDGDSLPAHARPFTWSDLLGDPGRLSTEDMLEIVRKHLDVADGDLSSEDGRWW